MAVPLEKFVQQLEDSGVLNGDTLKDFIPPKSSPKDATDLARELVRQKKLTTFQVEEVSKGNGKSLVLGNYVLMEKIGAGGMGQVFKARHRRMDRIVAVKLLPSAMTKDAAAIARFEREVKAAAKLRHPNIVAADDADCANGVHFLVMELIEGSDLSALVKKNGPFPVEQAVNCVLQAARGLEAAHKKGIVHRDIKPANLLLDSEGVVKILDMGLARLNGDEETPTQAELTGTGTVMGTVDFMAPEQALSTKTADARADIYALGCSLYYLLTGKSTYEGETLMAKLLAHRDQPIPSLRATRSDVPEEIEVIFRRMVAKTVMDRYQTMTDVIADLKQSGVLHQQSSQTQPILPSPSATSLPSFQSGVSAATTQDVPTKKPAPGKGGKRPYLLIGTVVIGVLILLAGLVVKVKTKDGTLVVTVNEPDAQVEVLNEEGKVEVSQKGGKGTISISVDPGKHRLKVTKDGFTVFGQDFEIESGGQQPITAKLVPLNEKPVAGTKPVPAAVPVAGPKKPLFFQTPEFEPWAKGVAAMPAEQQVEAVSKKLVELNPGFDGKVTGFGNSPAPAIENGTVATFGVPTNEVSDISPVRALVGLKHFRCDPSMGGQSKLTGLSPLNGMKLESLNCTSTFVYDLSPLAGMPLTYLSCGYIPATDFSVIKGLPLNALDVTGLAIFDLSDLNGLPLTTLNIYNTPVSDLTPLKGLPLTNLDMSATFAADLSPLRDVPLQKLNLCFNPNHDIAMLRSIKTLEMINGKPVSVYCDAVEAYKEGAKKPLAFLTPGFDQWAKDVAAMPAEKQVEAVSKKLVELNSEFDGKVTPTIEDGVVTTFRFLTDNVTDISPVRALAGIRSLDCSRSGLLVQGGLGDLSPLRGIPLVGLHVHESLVSDLSPLKEMKTLTHLSFGGIVTDLTPLKDVPLMALGIGGNPVSDLSPLKDMPLKSLSMYKTLITDISPLQGMRLETFICYNTKVSNFSTLRGTPLCCLDLRKTRVTNFSLLKDLPLKDLSLDFKPERDTALLRSIKTLETINNKPVAEFWKEVEGTTGPKKPLFFQTPGYDPWAKEVAAMPAEQQVEAVSKKLVELNPGFDGKVWNAHGSSTPKIEDGVVTEIAIFTDDVSDISPLRVLSGLKRLTCNGFIVDQCKLCDLSPLRGMSLSTAFTFNCGRTNVFDLSPLRGMSIRGLHLTHTQVTDLSALHGMQLEAINCSDTQVSDLSPLTGMPLQGVEFNTTNVTDLSPLKGMQLGTLVFSNTPVSDLSPLKGMLLLNTLDLRNSKVSDLTLLKDMPLKTLYLDFKPFRDTELLRSIKTLETINGKPAADFWKEADAKQAAFDQWVKEVAAMPAEQQVEAVSKKLVELNPGFDGKVKGWGRTDMPTIEDGVATAIMVVTDSITDISPLRALSGLRWLACEGSLASKGKLVDLSPLRGLKLTRLGCGASAVFDLSPLNGMPLTQLAIPYTQVSDLSPLKGMKLTSLACSATKVADLSPLEGMPLEVLSIEYSEATDLSPLKDMLLTSLKVGPAKVKDFSPLKGMPLVSLFIVEQNISDLSQFKDFQLTMLSIVGNPVSDLSPLKDMPIEFLNIVQSSVTDLTPLKNMPLKTLYLDFKPYRDTELLRSIKTLETINDKPIAEFWKEAEVKKAAFDQWVKDVQAMPAEKQVEAVSKKLVEMNPGFDGKVTPTIQEGMVTGLQFLTDNVTDISPVRALVGVKEMILSPTNGVVSKLADLTPLSVLALTKLRIEGSPVFDLTPLKGMPLNELLVGWSPRVSDLSSLKGMPLTRLRCNSTLVADLSPLKGMLLTYLDCSYTQVSDLSPLKDMPLISLRIEHTQVSDISPLKRLPLLGLGIEGTPVTDLSPLKGIPLTWLDFSATQVTDLTPIKDMPLKELHLDFKPFRDTELLRSIKTLETINDKPIAEFWKEAEAKQTAFDQWVKDVQAMPAEKQVEAVSKKLVELNPGFDGKVTGPTSQAAPIIDGGTLTGIGFLADNVTDISPVRALVRLKHLDYAVGPHGTGNLADLSPLKGMALDLLNCRNTKVADLSPLLGMPLASIDLSGTKVTDLSPLKGMPLNRLDFNTTSVRDLSPLKGLPLSHLSLNHAAVTDLSPLIDMKLLTYLSTYDTPINDLSPLNKLPLKDLNIFYATSSLKRLDLSQLKGLRLETLLVNGAHVADLSPLREMPLKTLVLANFAEANDVIPLEEYVANLTPLKELPLQHLWIRLKPFHDTDLLRSIKTLETINGKPTAEFWKEVEEQQKEKKQ